MISIYARDRTLLDEIRHLEKLRLQHPHDEVLIKNLINIKKEELMERYQYRR